MLDFIMVPAVMGIIVLGIYKLFELFVRKKERLIIIEKIGDKLTPDMLNAKIEFPVRIPNFSSAALKIGCLLMSQESDNMPFWKTSSSGRTCSHAHRQHMTS